VTIDVAEGVTGSVTQSGTCCNLRGAGASGIAVVGECDAGENTGPDGSSSGNGTLDPNDPAFSAASSTDTMALAFVVIVIIALVM